jgi:hypothetical protein
MGISSDGYVVDKHKDCYRSVKEHPFPRSMSDRKLNIGRGFEANGGDSEMGLF